MRERSTNGNNRPTMSPTHTAISGVVACTCGQQNLTAASNLSSAFSMILWTVHFGKYNSIISLSKLQPVSKTVWENKAGFDQLVLTIYVLLKSHSVADLITLISRKVPIGHAQGLMLRLQRQSPTSSIVSQCV